MAIQPKPTTLEDFVAFALLPENSEHEFEFIHGEVIELSPGRSINGGIANRIVVAVSNFCTENVLPSDTTSGEGAYNILGNTIVPDFAYKHEPLSEIYPDPVPPEWAAEVISPTDRPAAIRRKRAIYIEAGILFWEIYPEERVVDVYSPGQPLHSVGIDGLLDGGDVLPGFTIAVRTIFRI